MLNWPWLAVAWVLDFMFPLTSFASLTPCLTVSFALSHAWASCFELAYAKWNKPSQYFQQKLAYIRINNEAKDWNEKKKKKKKITWIYLRLTAEATLFLATLPPNLPTLISFFTGFNNAILGYMNFGLCSLYLDFFFFLVWIYCQLVLAKWVFKEGKSGLCWLSWE